MSADLMPFLYGADEMRSLVIDNEPWFVASDVARILGYRMASDMTRRIDDADKGYAKVRTPGGDQDVAVINESGLYDSIFRSNAEGAKPFRRWVTSEVLPQVRKTGTYATPESREQLIARALIESQSVIAEKDQRIAELTGPAESWEHFASTDGDLSVNEAAKVLSRHPGIAIGERRLWNWLDEHHWTYRDAAGDRRAYQGRIESGHLTARARGHHHPATGEWVMDAPQVRVPMKGVELLRKHLVTQLAVVPA